MTTVPASPTSVDDSTSVVPPAPPRERLLPWFAVAALTLWFCGGVLFGGQCFSFRDSGHFYVPLFRFVQQEWGAGRFPLWNDVENGGQPLLGDGTSSVLYPGKLIFALPLDYLLAYKLYIVGHLVLAFAGTYAVARAWGADRPRATLAGIAYAFGGNVLFQNCNVIFLCGAAWLPWAWLLGERLFETRRLSTLAALSAVPALMVLAGDPQMAYVAGLSLLGLACFRRGPAEHAPPTATAKPAPAKAGSRSREAAPAAPRPGFLAGLRSRLNESPRARRCGLILAALLGAGLLAAVQILPTQEFSQLSQRSLAPLPRSVWGVPKYLLRRETPVLPDRPNPAWYDALLGRRTRVDAFHGQMYTFSLGPWRPAEFVLPNVFGSPYPIHARWLSEFPADELMWAPTSYLGLLPFVLGLANLTWFRGDRRSRFLAWMFLLCLLLSFGGYGPGWLLLAPAHGWPDPTKLGAMGLCRDFGPEVGGLYWLGVVLVPGWEGFRFPAKMLLPACLALSLLGALPGTGGGSLLDAAAKARRWWGRLAVLGLTTLAVALAIAPWWNGWFALAEGDPTYGPLDRSAAWWAILGAGLRTACLAGAAWYVLPRWAALGDPAGRSGFVLVLVTVLDVATANGVCVPQVPDEIFRTPPRVLKTLAAGRAAEPSLLRVQRSDTARNETFVATSSPDRTAAAAIWERDRLFGRHLLPWARTYGVESSNTVGTIDTYDRVQFFAAALRDARHGGPPDRVRPRRGVDAWSVERFLLPQPPPPTTDDESVEGLERAWTEPRFTPDHPQGAPGGEPLPTLAGPPETAEATRLVANPSALPRARVVRSVFAFPPLDDAYGASRLAVLQAMLFPVEKAIDLRTAVVLEDRDFAEPQTFEFAVPPADPNAPPEVRIVRHEPTEVDLECRLRAPGVVVLSDAYFPGWEATVEPLAGGPAQPVLIHRANRIMRGVMLPAGDCRLRFRYVPSAFRTGAFLSLLALAAGAAIVALRLFAPHRLQPLTEA